MQNYAFNYRIHREPRRAIFQITQNKLMVGFIELKNS